MPFLTIFTPTYNRKELLPKLYQSLCQQTNKDFLWLVVDDGSTDDTAALFPIWQAEADFEIRYEYKENGGKHRAMNYSHPYLKGELVVIVDSDDILTPDAVETINAYWGKYGKQGISMLILQKGGVSGNHEQFDKNFLGEDQVNELSFFTNHGMSGDHCEVVPVREFCKYSFPDYPSEKFMGEAWLWCHIAKSGPAVFINKVIYLCEYLEGGLTNSGRAMRLKNPLGGQEHARVFLEKEFKNKIRLKNAMLYVCYGRIARQSLGEMMKNSGHALLVLAAYLPGILLRIYWIKKYI